jgi:hypothetical protein
MSQVGQITTDGYIKEPDPQALGRAHFDACLNANVEFAYSFYNIRADWNRCIAKQVGLKRGVAAPPSRVVEEANHSQEPDATLLHIL